jgi:hypothetical protein
MVLVIEAPSKPEPASDPNGAAQCPQNREESGLSARQRGHRTPVLPPHSGGKDITS